MTCPYEREKINNRGFCEKMSFRRSKNTKKKGILHYVIFKWNGRFLGICKETGFVEESKNFYEVKEKLSNGTIALLKAVWTSPQDLEPSLNTSPPLKYAIYYRIAPVLGTIELIKDSSKTEAGFYSFTENIPALRGNV